ncbi:MAG: twin-arginine translocase TatA/TatE family subunit [Bdellovibrionales bacterium]
MLSLTHILIFLLIALVVFGPSRLPGLGRGLAEGLRNFKKGLRGEGDIDITDSVKRLPDDEENGKRKG